MALLVNCRIQAIYQGDEESLEKGYFRSDAGKIERCVFDMAKSRPDYYIRMAEEISKLNSLSSMDFILYYYSTWSMIASDEPVQVFEFTNDKSYVKMMKALADENIMNLWN